MDALLQKIDTLINARPIDFGQQPDQNASQSMLDAYGQQMEDYLSVLDDLIQTVGSSLKRLRDKQQHFQRLVLEAGQTIEQFQKEGQRSLALAARNHSDALQQTANAYQEEADALNARFLALMDVKLRLDARLTEVNQRRVGLFEPAF
ncbi:MAG: hypothetical protein DSY55_02155 [Clostridia bacterium]|nr:MAG: hypothetical protein DSY55_02155 [Clostridia bacterium]